MMLPGIVQVLLLFLVPPLSSGSEKSNPARAVWILCLGDNNDNDNNIRSTNNRYDAKIGTHRTPWRGGAKCWFGPVLVPVRRAVAWTPSVVVKTKTKTKTKRLCRWSREPCCRIMTTSTNDNVDKLHLERFVCDCGRKITMPVAFYSMLENTTTTVWYCKG
jgi:hypothetical protein